MCGGTCRYAVNLRHDGTCRTASLIWEGAFPSSDLRTRTFVLDAPGFGHYRFGGGYLFLPGLGLCPRWPVVVKRGRDQYRQGVLPPGDLRMWKFVLVTPGFDHHRFGGGYPFIYRFWALRPRWPEVNLEVHTTVKCHEGDGVKQRVLLYNNPGKEKQVEMMFIVMSLDCQVVSVFTHRRVLVVFY